MATGNAPWPIGVTMVGIHARTGREKIFSKHVAHVLNDETQRNYIQGLKNMEEAIVPDIYDPSQIDVQEMIESEEAISMAREIIRREAIFAGMSSGAAMLWR